MQDELPGPNEPLFKEEKKTISVLNEFLTVKKKIVETGRIHISKKIQLREENFNVPVMQEHVNVERITINQYVNEAPQIRQVGKTMIIPVLKEVWVVRKELLLIEEIHVTRTQTEEIISGTEMLREEVVDIVQTPAPGSDEQKSINLI